MERGRGMKAMKAILGFALMVGLVSCSSSDLASNYDRVASDYDREVDFTSLKTFGWMSRSNLAYTPLLEKRIRNAVDQALTSEGYQKETTGNPDFLIAYRTDVEDKSDVTSYGYGYCPGYHTSDIYGFGQRHYRSYGYGYRPRYYGHGTYALHQYKEGTVTLDFIDAESNHLVWRGWYVGAVADREISEEQISTVVKHILEQFPPEVESPSLTIY